MHDSFLILVGLTIGLGSTCQMDGRFSSSILERFISSFWPWRIIAISTWCNPRRLHSSLHPDRNLKEHTFKVLIGNIDERRCFCDVLTQCNPLYALNLLSPYTCSSLRIGTLHIQCTFNKILLFLLRTSLLCSKLLIPWHFISLLPLSSFS